MSVFTAAFSSGMLVEGPLCKEGTVDTWLTINSSVPRLAIKAGVFLHNIGTHGNESTGDETEPGTDMHVSLCVCVCHASVCTQCSIYSARS